MHRLRLFLVILIFLAAIFVATPYVASLVYKAQLHSALSKLQSAYQSELQRAKQLETPSAALSVLKPFTQNKLPHLLNLGSFAWIIPSYAKAVEQQNQASQLVSGGADFYHAFQQLVDFNTKSALLVAKYKSITNTSTVEGLKNLAQAYRDEANLRQQTVTSSLLSGSTSNEVSNFHKISDLVEQKAVAIAGQNTPLLGDLESKLSSAALTMSVQNLSDSPTGFTEWRGSIDQNLKQLISNTN